MKLTTENKPRVIITGSLGYIGSEFFKEIKEKNIEYLLIDKEPQTGPGKLSFNLGDYEKTFKTIKDFQPDVFIHCGTHSAIAYRDNFLESFTEDLQALTNILKSLSAVPQCRLIYFSSSYVYSGLPITGGVSENSLLAPKHNFGVAKSFFEQFILRNHKNSVIFRLSSVFGAGESKYPNTVLNFAKECLEKGEINIWGQGDRKIQYVFMKDVLNYILEAFHIEPGIYNLGGDDYVSIADAAQTIAKFFNAKIVFLKDKPEGEALPFLFNDKIKKVSNKNLFTTFLTSLIEYLGSIK